MRKPERPPVQVATIDGEPVMAALWYGADDELDIAEVLLVHVVWMEQRISTDGKDFINLPSDGDFGGDFSLEAFGWLKEAISAGVIDQLVALAQRVVDRPLAA